MKRCNYTGSEALNSKPLLVGSRVWVEHWRSVVPEDIFICGFPEVGSMLVAFLGPCNHRLIVMWVLILDVGVTNTPLFFVRS